LKTGISANWHKLSSISTPKGFRIRRILEKLQRNRPGKKSKERRRRVKRRRSRSLRSISHPVRIICHRRT